MSEAKWDHPRSPSVESFLMQSEEAADSIKIPLSFEVLTY